MTSIEMLHKTKWLFSNLFFGTFLSFVNDVDAQKISLGGRHSLALCQDGKVTSWGYNGFGQLGIGGIKEQATGTNITGLPGIVAIGAGLFHSLFIDKNGEVWSCGRNTNGPLGDGSNTNKDRPTLLGIPKNVKSVTGGGEHSLFLTHEGKVWSCGLNSSGQLGHGNTSNSNVPLEIKNLDNVVQITAGAEYSLFLKSDGSVWACGHNGYGQFGNGTNISSRTPVKIEQLSNIINISAGEWHSIFVKADGTVFSAGRNNFGQLGLGNTTDNNKATVIDNLKDIVQADAGGIHSVFVKNDGTVYSCGLNSGGNNDGQLGDGTRLDKNSPVVLVKTWGLSKINYAEATREHTLLLDDSGMIWGTGRNNYGQLATGVITPTNSLVVVKSNSNCNLVLGETNMHHDETDECLMYPNPSHGMLHMHFRDEVDHVTMRVNNMQGQIVETVNNISGKLFRYHTNHLPEGLYMFEIWKGDNRLLMNRVVIK